MKTKFLAAAAAASILLTSAVSVFAQDFVVREFNNIDETDDSTLTINSIEVTPENAGLYDFTARMNILASNSFKTELRVVRTAPTDVSAYSFVNLLVYSPKLAAKSNIIIDLYDSYPHRARYEINVDWTGWRQITIPTSSFANVANETYNNETFKQFKLTTNNSDKSWSEESYLCVDKIWFSTDDSYSPAAGGTEIDLSEGVASVHASVNTDAEYLYMKDSSVRFRTYSTGSEGTGIVTLNTPVSVSDANYINFWMYSDRDMSYTNSDGDIAVPNVRFSIYDGTEPYTCTRSNVLVDFAGWKLITIPLSDFEGFSALSNPAIGKVRFVSNRWTRFNEDCYLYFDKMWLSSEAPTCMCSAQGVSSESKDGVIRSTDDKLQLMFSGAVAAVKDSTKIVLTTADGTVIPTDAQLLAPDKIGITPSVSLESGASYRLTVGADAVADANGIGNDENFFDFSTAAAGIEVTTPILFDGTVRYTQGAAANRARVAASIYNSSAVDKNIMLIIASYSEVGSVLKGIRVKYLTVPAASSKTGLSETIQTESGDIVRSFVWDDMFRPLYK